MNAKIPYTRIEKLLDYIHDNIQEPLSLDELAAKSCWSRWQLQRVFQAYTGFSVAQYVREIKLSQAALMVLDGKHRILDVAYEFGFNSEIAFSRAFKQFFGVSPKRYQSNGLKTGIKTPLTKPIKSSESVFYPENTLYQVRLEHKNAFSINGVPSIIRGLQSAEPDFSSTVPYAWETFFKQTDLTNVVNVPHIGIIDMSPSQVDGELIYWAGVEQVMADKPSNSELICKKLEIGECSYAVMPYQGDVDEFHKAVTWLVAMWLPESGYKTVDNAFEMEIYHPPFDNDQRTILAEYWLPIHQ